MAAAKRRPKLPFGPKMRKKTGSIDGKDYEMWMPTHGEASDLRTASKQTGALIDLALANEFLIRADDEKRALAKVSEAERAAAEANRRFDDGLLQLVVKLGRRQVANLSEADREALLEEIEAWTTVERIPDVSLPTDLSLFGILNRNRKRREMK